MRIQMNLNDKKGFESINQVAEFDWNEDSYISPRGGLGLVLAVYKTEYFVEIRTNDYGDNPHFHVYNKDESFLSCIRLDKADYFLHGPYKDKLNSKSRKLLDQLLNLKVKDEETGVEVSNWKRLVDDWNRNENRHPVDAVVIPNYRNLPPKEG